MKYKIYEKSETLERYSVKKNLFNKKYTVKLHYVNSRYYAVYEAKDKFDLLEYERFLLDRMNNQMMDLLESDEVVNNVDLMITEKDEKFKKISNIVSFSIPLIFSFAYNQLTSLTIPNSVTSIRDSAFYKCKSWNSNPNLTKIINKTGNSFNWGQIINGSSGYEFVTGTVENDDGNVEITSGK